jgi:FtsP/CotA-like multicopper oxidase with cupredoxin domain
LGAIAISVVSPGDGAESERGPGIVEQCHRAADAMPRIVSMLAALGALVVAGLLAPPVNAATLTYPVVLSSGNTYPSEWAATITVEPHYFDNGQAKFWSRAFCSAGPVCAGVGPTIEVVAGDDFTLTVTNNLGANPAGEDTTRNSMHSPNTTNLHTHGLHIDPVVDTVFIRAEPGTSLVYLYKVPVNHAAGTYWYHDHAHGRSAMAVMVGRCRLTPD